MTHRLASGQFLGTDAVRQSAAGFNVALWRATVPPEAVRPHVHDDAHFVLTLDPGIDVHQLPHPIQPQYRETGLGQSPQIPAGTLDPDQLDRLTGHRISLGAFS